jgi:hypothetical protein
MIIENGPCPKWILSYIKRWYEFGTYTVWLLPPTMEYRADAEIEMPDRSRKLVKKPGRRS